MDSLLMTVSGWEVDPTDVLFVCLHVVLLTFCQVKILWLVVRIVGSTQVLFLCCKDDQKNHVFPMEQIFCKVQKIVRWSFLTPQEFN